MTLRQFDPSGWPYKEEQMGRPPMTDRERVMMNIAVDTSGTVHDTFKRIEGGWTLRYRFDRPAPQFIPTVMADTIGLPLKNGDIVRCQTNPNHAWGISELMEQTGCGNYLLREIGGDALLNMGNEMVEVLRFMDGARLYTGVKNRVYRWASNSAFSTRYNPDADYWKRCGGVEFDGNKLKIWMRPHIFVAEKRQKDGPVTYAQPKMFELEWSKKTRLKDIVNAMREQGFAEDFEYGPDEPTNGNAGVVKITRDSLVKTLSSAGVTI